VRARTYEWYVVRDGHRNYAYEQLVDAKRLRRIYKTNSMEDQWREVIYKELQGIMYLGNRKLPSVYEIKTKQEHHDKVREYYKPQRRMNDDMRIHERMHIYITWDRGRKLFIEGLEEVDGRRGVGGQLRGG